MEHIEVLFPVGIDFAFYLQRKCFVRGQLLIEPFAEYSFSTGIIDPILCSASGIVTRHDGQLVLFHSLTDEQLDLFDPFACRFCRQTMFVGFVRPAYFDSDFQLATQSKFVKLQASIDEYYVALLILTDGSEPSVC